MPSPGKVRDTPQYHPLDRAATRSTTGTIVERSIRVAVDQTQPWSQNVLIRLPTYGKNGVEIWGGHDCQTGIELGTQRSGTAVEPP